MSSRLTDRYRDGTVIEKYPTAGQQVDPWSSVTLVTAEEGVRVPHIMGRQLKDVAGTISNAGLSYSVTHSTSRQYPEGSVISQSPAAGTLVRRGTQLRLTLATKPPQCMVPKVYGGYFSAVQTLRNAGFNTRTNGPTDRNAVVQSQWPAANSRVECGSTVILQTHSIEPQPQPRPQPGPMIKQPEPIYRPQVISPDQIRIYQPPIK